MVPAAPGGSSDAVARAASNHYQAVFKQPFVIEHRPGAGNTLGAAQVARAEPDGYTLVISNPAAHLTGPLTSKNAGYDPVKDFTHIVMLSGSPYVLAVYPGYGTPTLKEFIAKVRASAAPVSFTGANPGGLGHMGGELLKQLAKLDMQHVSYRGGGPALSDVIGGHVPAIFLPMSTLGEQIRAGKLQAVAVTARKRLTAFPDLPTFAEQGYPDLVYSAWFGLAGPRGMPPDVVRRLNDEARAMLRQPAMRQIAEREGSEILDVDAEIFSRMIATEVARWSKVLESSGLRAAN